MLLSVQTSIAGVKDAVLTPVEHNSKQFYCLEPTFEHFEHFYDLLEFAQKEPLSFHDLEDPVAIDFKAFKKAQAINADREKQRERIRKVQCLSIYTTLMVD